MRPLLMWTVGYLIPGLLALAIPYAFRTHPWRVRITFAALHVGTLLSVLVCQYLLHANGVGFPLRSGPLSLALVAVAVIVSACVLGRLGIWYSLSAFLQQLTMASVTALLLPSVSLPLIVLLVAPFYALSHLLDLTHWKAKLAVTLVWGILSVVVYAWTADLALTTGIHVAGGALLLSRGIIYPHRQAPRIAQA